MHGSNSNPGNTRDLKHGNKEKTTKIAQPRAAEFCLKFHRRFTVITVVGASFEK